MYTKFGQIHGDVRHLADMALAGAITWNPPGWGSGPASEELMRLVATQVPGYIRLGMVTAMRPGSYIPFHCDAPAEENGLSGHVLRRFHLVLATNSRCWMFHDGTWQQLEAGTIYQMDPSLEHASINFGETVRVHLVVDTEA